MNQQEPAGVLHFAPRDFAESNISYGNHPAECGEIVPVEKLLRTTDPYAISSMCERCYRSRHPLLTMADIMGGPAYREDGSRIW